MSGVWDAVREALERGEDPALNLLYETAVQPPKRPRGRPKLKPEERARYAYRNIALLGDKARPRCLNPKCRKRLRVRDNFVCDETCRRAAIIAYRQVLNFLLGRPFVVPKRKPRDVPEVPVYGQRRSMDEAEARAILASERSQRASATPRPRKGGPAVSR